MKKQLQGKNLELVGWFDIPLMRFETTLCPRAFDISPVTGKWVATHGSGYILEFDEPHKMNTPEDNGNYTLKLTSKTEALKDTNKVNPSGVIWLDDETVLTSGRKSYRSGFEESWLSEVNLKTGDEKYYAINAESNTENDNFHIIQALGGGFVRVFDKEWSDKNLDGAGYLLGKGGYDVLGSPLGPAIAKWNKGEPHCTILLDYEDGTPAPRDPYYAYPDLDPNTYDKVQLPIWKTPVDGKGFWQGGDCGGSCIINHPIFEGVIYTHNFARGILDYRAQGDGGSGKYFSVSSPSIFYTDRSWKTNRGDHESEIGNSVYPDGLTANTGNVISPDFLAKSYAGKLKPHEADVTSFDWPRDGIKWDYDWREPTTIGGCVWDDIRQLLWTTIGTRVNCKLVAYTLVDDDSRPEPPLILTKELREFFEDGKLPDGGVIPEPEPTPEPEPDDTREELESLRKRVELIESALGNTSELYLNFKSDKK